MLWITFSKNSAEQLKTIIRVPTIYNSKLLAIRSEQIISSGLLLSGKQKQKQQQKMCVDFRKTFFKTKSLHHY